MRPTARVLLVGPLPPPSGGMANQTRQLLHLLQQDGVDVDIVQTNQPYRPAWVASVRGVRALVRLLPYLRDLWAKCAQVDVVHVMANSGLAWDMFAAPAIAVAKWRGCRVIVNYRGGLAGQFLQGAAGRVRRSLRGADVVVPSTFLQAVFARHGMAARVIPNVVDTGIFRPGHRPAAGQGTSPHVIVARNLEPIYGIDLALRAIAILRRDRPGLRCSIAGSGPDEARLRELARALAVDDCTRFTGRLEVADMVGLYQDADLVLNPVRVDNAPNSVLEALACGVPVVSTSVGGIPHLVEHGTSAFLVDPESPEALAAGMAQVLADDALRRRLIDGGSRLVQQFTWAGVRRQWLDAYDRPGGSA